MWRRDDEDVVSGRMTVQHGESAATRARHDEDVASVRAWRRDGEGAAARRRGHDTASVRGGSGRRRTEGAAVAARARTTRARRRRTEGAAVAARPRGTEERRRRL
jgi:hypothetical protein